REDSDGLLHGLMRMDINTLFGRMASLSRRLCGRETTHALVEKKGKTKDEFYGKLILDLGNEVRSSVEQGTAAIEKLVEKLGNAEDKVECKKLNEEFKEARGQDAAPVAHECTFAGFMKCNPTAFRGTEGAVELLRWFKKTENVFGISECAEGKKVRYNAVQNDGNEVGQNAVQNPTIQIVENMNGLSVVLEIKNRYRNRNVVIALAEGNGNGINDAYIETKRVKVNCTSDYTLPQASTSRTQSENAPVYDLNESTKIKWLQAQLGDLKGKSNDTQCASNTLDLVSQKLEDENVSL
nr:putative reverse transcriptase domain-containing protein [Tanacetum cinerariifolium]